MIIITDANTGKPLRVNPSSIQAIAWCWWRAYSHDHLEAQGAEPSGNGLSWTVGSIIYIQGVRWFVREAPNVVEDMMQNAWSLGSV